MPNTSRYSSRCVSLFIFAGLFMAAPAGAQETSLEGRLGALQRQNEALQRQSDILQRQMEELQRQMQRVSSMKAQEPQEAKPTYKPTVSRGTGAGGPELGFGGQYRVNAYYVGRGGGGGDQAAARVRIRQNLDIKFDQQFKTHLQLELGHTTDNVTTTNSSSRGTNIAVRHAVMDYTFDRGINFQAGIVPLSDHFGDTLFSSDWDYNPVALNVTIPIAGGTLRAFGANLNEGMENVAKDDFVHAQLDYVRPLAEGRHQINAGGSFVTRTDTGGTDYFHTNYGIGGRFQVMEGLVLKGFVLGSHTDRKLLGLADDADGVAAKLELGWNSGFALMATHASGDSDGSGYLPVMALAGTNGYWGYTGLLTVQGPTDTGFDGDSVNISNNGYGLTTVQARFARPLTDKFDIYLAAGWFGNSDTPSGRDETVGVDFIAMGTYHFNEIFALDFGAAFAMLEDSVSGYSNGVIGGTTFNQGASYERNKTALFTRLQAEF